MEKIKHFFASANTGNGFYNSFKDICPDGFVYVLKGGPGTGKSTLMKTVGEYFYNAGYSIEYFHCSSDIQSLDGVRIVEKNIAIVDGTAPHVTEVDVPSITGKIVNVGDFIGNSVVNNKKRIAQLLQSKSEYFIGSYQYLKIAKIFLDLLNTEYLNEDKKKDLDIVVGDIFNYYGDLCHKHDCYCRKLFLRCGFDNFSQLIELNKFTHTYHLQLPINSANYLLESLINKFISAKVSVIRIANNIDPEFIDGIYIPEIDVLIFNNFNGYYSNKKLVISGQQKFNYSMVVKVMKKIDYLLLKAKTAHKGIEKFYVASMNFNGLNDLVTNLIIDIDNRK